MCCLFSLLVQHGEVTRVSLISWQNRRGLFCALGVYTKYLLAKSTFATRLQPYLVPPFFALHRKVQLSTQSFDGENRGSAFLFCDIMDESSNSFYPDLPLSFDLITSINEILGKT